jgi:Mrp family chromosome partitioning ATPase
MDGVVLVAHANKTRRQVARYVSQRLQESGGEVLGLVLNRTLNFIPEWLYRWL